MFSGRKVKYCKRIVRDKMTETADREDPRRQFSDQDLIEAVSQHEPAGTQEIAEAVGASRRAVEYRLQSLAEDDDTPLQVKKIGRALVWYLDNSF